MERQRKPARRHLLLMGMSALVAYGAALHAADGATGQRPSSAAGQACVGIDDLHSRDTPADIYPHTAACIEKGDHDRALATFTLAGMYGRYDAKRVSDRTAAQVIPALQSTWLQAVDEQKKQAFADAMSGLKADPAYRERLCRDIGKLGPPDYHPDYMINHGMGAFTEQGRAQPLVADFDAQATWASLMQGYLKCESDS